MLEGPINSGSKGRPFSSSIVDLAGQDYREEEYFLSGEAQTWGPATGRQPQQDGQWNAARTGLPQRYKTRLMLRIPPPGRFNGILVVEWMQELFGTERDIFFRWNAEAIMRSGYAWAGVSLHSEGVNGESPNSLCNWDGERYSSLKIPNSDCSYDIFSHAVRQLRGPGGPLGHLPVSTVLAAGNSLSGWRLSTYLNAVQPVDGLVDGFFLQDFRQKTVQDRIDIAFPHDRYLRADSTAPAIMLNMTPAAIRSAGQPRGAMLRRWEPAGASHTNSFFMTRTALAEKRDTGASIECCAEDYANSIPSQYFSGAALEALAHWTLSGNAPAEPDPIQLSSLDGSPSLDEHGNVEGGLRHPWVDVPRARYGWEGECPGGSGRTFPFSERKFRGLYGDAEQYRHQFVAAARAAMTDKFLLSNDCDVVMSTHF